MNQLNQLNQKSVIQTEISDGEKSKAFSLPIVEDIEDIPKNIKTLEMVQCSGCLKQITANTLRYHHKCPGEVIKREEIPVKKRVKKETSPKPKEETKAPEKPTLTNTYQERLQKALEKRSETMQKLASQIV